MHTYIHTYIHIYTYIYIYIYIYMYVCMYVCMYVPRKLKPLSFINLPVRDVTLVRLAKLYASPNHKNTGTGLHRQKRA